MAKTKHLFDFIIVSRLSFKLPYINFSAAYGERKNGTATLYSSEVFYYGFIGVTSTDV